MTGRADGSWKRLTDHPVAWWERRYITQGVGLAHEGAPAFSGHAECLSYRVIAVDEAGNESDPAYANNPPASSCPATPQPPKNLRASNGPTAAPPAPPTCTTHLEWDASPGATEYYVYRLVISSYVPPYFYDTKRLLVTGQASSYSYDEEGDPWDAACVGYGPDGVCGYHWVYQYQSQCSMGDLNAYYVTARGATGGESPRSNLVFWKCGTSYGDGYAKVLSDENPTDAITTMGARLPEESLACWNTDGASPHGVGEVEDDQPEEIRPPVFATAPMLRLGQVADPAWKVLELHTDHFGSVRVITESHGWLVSAHNYFPFGEEIAPKPLSYNTHRYTGHERDKETGLDYMLARYYDDSLPRFMSPDPGDQRDIEDPQLWNLYAYAGNNPLRFTDPDGEEMRDNTSLNIAMMSNAQMAVAAQGIQDGWFRVSSDSLKQSKSGEMIVETAFDIDIASDHTASFSDIEKHEFGHRDDWLNARQELGYGNLDKQLERTYNDIVAKGTRKGWSPAKIEDAAKRAADRQYRKAFHEILRLYNKKRKQRDPNSYGIDPDGPLGPQGNPCDGKGPMCGGGALL